MNLLGIDAEVPESVARGDIGRGPVAVDADSFAFQLRRCGNSFDGDDLKRKRVDDPGDHHEVRTGQVAGDNRGPGHRHRLHFSNQHGRRGRRAARDKNQTDVQPLLLEPSSLLGDPDGRERARLSAVTDRHFFHGRLRGGAANEAHQQNQRG